MHKLKHFFVIYLTNKYINSLCKFITLINKCQGSIAKLQGKAPPVKMLRGPMPLLWLLLPCKIIKVSSWNAQQKMEITDWVIVVSIYYMYGIKLFFLHRLLYRWAEEHE